MSMAKLAWIAQQNVKLYLLILLTMLTLNGCSTAFNSHPDGAPSYPVDETKIPNAVPKKEALSQYGNNRTYRVAGKTYHTLSSSRNYDAKGIASWYGTRFHSIPTSSGERYNMFGMTAAHKTLPLPTYVRVTNLKNGKQVIVKINDRGPFSGNHLIDLSYVAAKKLGMIERGTALVDVKAIDVDSYNRSINTRSAHSFAQNNHPVYLQAGVFKQRAYAERLKTRLSKEIAAPVHISRAAKHLYRVQIGPIKDTAANKQISKQLKSLGLTKNIKSSVEV